MNLAYFSIRGRYLNIAEYSNIHAMMYYYFYFALQLGNTNRWQAIFQVSSIHSAGISPDFIVRLDIRIWIQWNPCRVKMLSTHGPRCTEAICPAAHWYARIKSKLKRHKWKQLCKSRDKIFHFALCVSPLGTSRAHTHTNAFAVDWPNSKRGPHPHCTGWRQCRTMWYGKHSFYVINETQIKSEFWMALIRSVSQMENLICAHHSLAHFACTKHCATADERQFSPKTAYPLNSCVSWTQVQHHQMRMQIKSKCCACGLPQVGICQSKMRSQSRKGKGT